jgi:Uma2 family endonuclease
MISPPILYDTPTYDPALREYVVGRDVSYADFLRLFEGQRTEWVLGTVIKDMTNNVQHQRIIFFISRVLLELLERLMGGDVLLAGVSMFVGNGFPAREPDILVLLPDNPATIEPTFVDGIADIVVEVVSPESTDRDYGTKFAEYEAIGVPEYWLIDPVRRQTIVYALQAGGRYQAVPQEQGHLRSHQLPQVTLPLELLWQTRTISPREIRQLVEGMLA